METLLARTGAVHVPPPGLWARVAALAQAAATALVSPRREVAREWFRFPLP